MNKIFRESVVKEGSTNVFVFKNKESLKGPGQLEKVPFYNPSMEENRDLSVVFGQWLINKKNKTTSFCDGLAASGIRGIRFANELIGDFNVVVNDWNKDCFMLIRKNIKTLDCKNIESSNLNLNTLLSERSFDYIDIDPFGSPVYFIDSSIRSLKNNGIIAVTATDTAALCGTYPKVCKRRYYAIPFHSYLMKEIGLRILIGFICRTALLYDKAIMPILSYSTDHYFRCYVKIINSVSQANHCLDFLKIVNSSQLPWILKSKKDIGPLWTGDLHNKNILKELVSILLEKELKTKNSLSMKLDLFFEESDAPIFFYTSDSLSSFFNKSPPKQQFIFDFLKKNSFNVFRTHFSPTGFKTNAGKNEIEKVFN